MARDQLFSELEPAWEARYKGVSLRSGREGSLPSASVYSAIPFVSPTSELFRAGAAASVRHLCEEDGKDPRKLQEDAASHQGTGLA